MAKMVTIKKTSSVQSRKQRAARYNAKLHTLQTFMHVNLSKDLRSKHNKRNVQVRKGDSVKVLRGQFKGKSGKVELVNLKRGFVNVAGLELVKRDGSKVFYPVNPSNLQIQILELSDSRRKASIARANNEVSSKEKDTI
jgi:large subunit ribosomal protein L24